MDVIPLCDITKAYTDIYVNTQQLLLNTTLFCTWRHVSAAHTAIFRPAYNRIGPFMRVGTLIMATIYLQLIQNRYMFRSFTVLQCSHQHCVEPVASDVEVVRYL